MEGLRSAATGAGIAIPRIRALQVLRMLELLSDASSLGRDVREVVADRLRIALAR